MNIKIDNEYLHDVTAVIVAFESQGMTEEEVVDHIEDTRPDLLINVKLFYAYRNAGKGNPLRLPLDQIDYSLLED